MKKIIIIILSVIVLAAAGIFGFVYCNLIPSKEYKTEHFSFKVPTSFKFIPNTPGENDYLFESMGAEIHIYDMNINCTPDIAGEYLKAFSDEKNTEPEKLTDCPYKGYFYSAESDSEGDNKLHMIYILGTDTYFLEISAYCKPSAEARMKSAIDHIVKKVEYTSDYRISDKPEVYDYDWLSVNTGSKYYLIDKTEDMKDSKENVLLRVNELYAQADDIGKMSFPKVSIQVDEGGIPAAERADKLYASKMELQDKYKILTRDRQEKFGFTCEHIYFEFNLKDGEADPLYSHVYYFDSGKYIYLVSASYRNSSDEDDIKEMLDGITIKDIK